MNEDHNAEKYLRTAKPVCNSKTCKQNEKWGHIVSYCLFEGLSEIRTLLVVHLKSIQVFTRSERKAL